MDSHGMYPLPTNQPPPPPPPPPASSSNTSFPILTISILGILATAILLVSYYVFVIKCCLNWRRSDVIGRLSAARSRRRHHEHLMIYSTITESHGLTESVIRAIPTFRFGRGAESEAMMKSFHECAVCLNEFQEEERLRLLPNCLHVFHIDCIDTWLQTNANCPVCRSVITGTSPIPIISQTNYQNLQPSGSVVIEVRDERSEQTSGSETHHNPSPKNPEQKFGSRKARKLYKEVFSSMGDECIDMRAKDDQFSIQPMRRSFSMDSSCDRQLKISVQEFLQQNPQFQEVANGEGSSSSSSSRIRRSFFSFGHGRSSRKAVLPIQIDQ